MPGLLRVLQRSWAGLSQSERDAWGLWANTIGDIAGEPVDRRASGAGAYIRTNAILAGSGQATLTAAPSEGTPFERVTPLDVQQDVSTQEIVIRTIDGLHSALSSPQTFRFQVSRPAQRSRSAFAGRGRIAGYAGPINDFFPWDPTPLRLPAPYTLTAGQPSWLTWRVATASGSVSVEARSLVDVPDAGATTAMRTHVEFGFPSRSTGGFVRVFPADAIRVWDNVTGVEELSITVASGNTLDDVRDWLIDTVGWEVRDFAVGREADLAATLLAYSSPFIGIWSNLALLQVPE